MVQSLVFIGSSVWAFVCVQPYYIFKDGFNDINGVN